MYCKNKPTRNKAQQECQKDDSATHDDNRRQPLRTKQNTTEEKMVLAIPVELVSRNLLLKKNKKQDR